MGKEQHGFTLIELLIVVTVIVIITTIAIPNLISARLTANEAAAIETLRAISSAQAQCQASRVIDDNGNGVGEFGYLGELSGATFVRADGGISPTEMVQPPVLSAAFGQVTQSRVLRSGYYFQMFLPDSARAFVAEAATGGAVAGAVDPVSAEVLWCCYAWPAKHGTSGNRAFFVNQRGDLLGCRNSITKYEGSASAPVPGTAAFSNAGASMSSTMAANTTGADGERWLVVN